MTPLLTHWNCCSLTLSLLDRTRELWTVVCEDFGRKWVPEIGSTVLHIADIFKWIFSNKNIRILINISTSPTNNIPALVQIVAWHRLGDTLLSDPMMVSSLTHIYVDGRDELKLKAYKVLGQTILPFGVALCSTMAMCPRLGYGSSSLPPPGWHLGNYQRPWRANWVPGNPNVSTVFQSQSH